MLGVVVAARVAGAVASLSCSRGRDRTQRGTGAGTIKAPAGRGASCSVSAASAHDYDPLGDDEEHHDAGARSPSTATPARAWSTESYTRSASARQGTASGIYVDAKPERRRRADGDPTRRRPAGARDLRAPTAAAPPKGIDGWTKLGGGTVARKRKRFTPRRPSTAYRYYLVWITKLPPGESASKISEIALFALAKAARRG